MIGNGHHGAVHKANKKNTGGSGDQKCDLRGKGSTPRARDCIYHTAHKRANEKRRCGSGRRERKGDGTELVTDRNPVVECLHAKVPAAALIMVLDTDNDERLQESVRITDSRGIPIREVPHHGLDTMTGNTVHQGIGLQIPPCKYSSVEGLIDSVTRAGEPGPIVCLDNITDPRNLGAVIRSATVFGGRGVAIPEQRPAAITGVAQHASAGTTTRLPVTRITDTVCLLKQFRKAGYQIVGLGAGGDHTPGTYNGITPMAVIVGSEGKGLSCLIRNTCNTIISILVAG